MTTKKRISRVFAVALAMMLMMALVAVPGFAAEKISVNDATVSNASTSITAEPRLFTTLYNKILDCRLANSTPIYYAANNSTYTIIECSNNGDTATGQGAIRFIVNGAVQDVGAGGKAQFTVSKNRPLSIAAQALWYDGAFNIRVRAD